MKAPSLPRHLAASIPVLLVLLAGSSADRAAADEIVRVGRTSAVVRALPYGPDVSGFFSGGFSAEIDELTYLSESKALAITSQPGPSLSRGRIFLNEVLVTGDLVLLGEIAPSPGSQQGEEVLDLKTDARGRLFLLTRARSSAPEVSHRLIELDPADGRQLGNLALPREVEALAAAPDGFWAASGGRIFSLDPATGELGGPSFPLGNRGLYDMDVDSTGSLWFWDEGVCSPPCPAFYRLDPYTGAITSGFGASDQAVHMQDLAIRRGCPSDLGIACLQGGRFMAVVRFKDFAGVGGWARVAAGRSADTGIFSFFDTNNWELMVKVLNGCDLNGHFWVYASASTTIEYELQVFDNFLGTRRSYTNASGQVAVSVTDGSAFPCR